MRPGLNFGFSYAGRSCAARRKWLSTGLATTGWANVFGMPEQRAQLSPRLSPAFGLDEMFEPGDVARGEPKDRYEQEDAPGDIDESGE